MEHTTNLSYKQLSATVRRFERVLKILESELDRTKIDHFIPEDKGQLVLSSTVEGSREEPYNVNAVLLCTCPDFKKSGNVCKHILAVLNRHNTARIEG